MGAERSKEEKERDLELYYRFKGDAKLIEDELLQRLDELRALCVQEAVSSAQELLMLCPFCCRP